MEYVTLANGVKMPQLGYGVYQVTKAECERCVADALKVGYRHIDTAQSYFNEEEVGNAVKNSGISREKLFITTKVWIEHYGYEECRKSVLESLRKLQLDYLDLVLLHQPFADYYGAWKALEELYAEGKLRAIGVSNFYPDRLVDICSFSRIKPMVNQGKRTRTISRKLRMNGWKSTASSMKHGHLSAKAEEGCLPTPLSPKSEQNTERRPRRSFCAGTCSAGS